MSESVAFNVTDNVAAKNLAEFIEVGILRGEEIPRVVEVSTDLHKDGVIYDGRIVIDNPHGALRVSDVEDALHQLKHCFKGDYEKASEWMVKDFRAGSGKHNRVSIAYTVTMRNSDESIIVNFHRSMGKGASGAHRLCKITPENTARRTEVTQYNGQHYYVVPLVNREANCLMQLFANMVVEALETRIFEQEVRKPAKSSRVDIADIATVVPPLFDTAMPAFS